MDKLQEPLDKIKVLESELSFEIQKKEEEFFYKIHGRKVYFEEAVRKQHKHLVMNIKIKLNRSEKISMICSRHVRQFDG
ncbi:MAG: hypothetical protein ABFR82_06355 [Nitrospirota bacterium]